MREQTLRRSSFDFWGLFGQSGLGISSLTFLSTAIAMIAWWLGPQQLSRAADEPQLVNTGDYRLAVGNELSGDRPWAGTMSLAAIYSRDLSSDEVKKNYRARLPDATKELQLTQADLNARHFETSVAPILARHCLECHDTSTNKGGLDLSSYKTAFHGGVCRD